MEPCTGATYDVQLAIVILGGLNTLLLTFLTNRRVIADRERRNGQSNGKSQYGLSNDKPGDVGGPTDGPPKS